MTEDNITTLLTERAKTHGDAASTFSLAGDLITALLAHRGSMEGIRPHEFAIVNILHKIARISCGSYHDDHWNDIKGYADLGKQLHKELTETCQGG